PQFVRRRFDVYFISSDATLLNKIAFFFSSRRRHTTSVSAFLLNRSSDLLVALSGSPLASTGHNQPEREKASCVRSEERRVGKECRSRWRRYHQKKENENNHQREAERRGNC